MSSLSTSLARLLIWMRSKASLAHRATKGLRAFRGMMGHQEPRAIPETLVLRDRPGMMARQERRATRAIPAPKATRETKGLRVRRESLAHKASKDLQAVGHRLQKSHGTLMAQRTLS
jgi:hypothetical protein